MLSQRNDNKSSFAELSNAMELDVTELTAYKDVLTCLSQFEQKEKVNCYI